MRMEVTEVGAGEGLDLAPPEGEEAAALLIAGELEIDSRRAGRAGPFDPPAAGWYLPPGSEPAARAGAASTVAIVTTKGAGLESQGGDVALVERAEGERRGRGEWERTVTTLIDPSTSGSRRLIAGQTVHASGGWSSFPPHRHDGSGDEPYFEEIYHYRFQPETGFGFQGLYADDGLSEGHLIRDGDTLTIGRGYHPVCAAPEHRFAYFWALCGPAELFRQVDDPVQAWVACRE
jgi:5-deoxy-glucuronate isomerase